MKVFKEVPEGVRVAEEEIDSEKIITFSYNPKILEEVRKKGELVGFRRKK